MEFSEDKPKKISDAEEIGIRTDALISDLRKIGQDYSDARRTLREKNEGSLEDQIRIVSSGFELDPKKSESKPSVNDGVKKQEESRKEGIRLPELDADTEIRVKKVIEAFSKDRKKAIEALEKARQEGRNNDASAIEGYIGKVDKELEVAHDLWKQLLTLKNRKFLEGIADELDSGDANK